LSLAKDHSCREALATELIVQEVRLQIRIDANTTVPTSLLVTFQKTCRNAKPVSLAKMSAGLPIVKQKAMVIKRPAKPLITTDQIIARGRMIEASRVSSAIERTSVFSLSIQGKQSLPMCTAESTPVKA
jgi:hypothetical protein